MAAGLAWVFAGTQPAAASSAEPPLGVKVRTDTLTGPFSPQQMVSAAGAIWLVGTMSSTNNQESCAIESVDPATLRRQLYSLPGCGPDAAVAGGQIYLTNVTYVAGTNNEQLRIERFDTSTKQATVLTPVDLTVVGSGIAHTAMTYGDGSLWLWGYSGAEGQDEVVQVSTTTGAVLRTVTGVPVIGGTQPSMAFADGGLWLAGGPGGSPAVKRLALGASKPSVVYMAPPDSAVHWVVASGNRVWASVNTFKDEGRVLAWQLVALSASRHRVLRATSGHNFSLGSPVSSTDGLWAVGVGGSCEDPLRLWQINSVTGVSKSIVTLQKSDEPCSAGSAVAVSGRTVFAMVSDGAAATVLYRLVR
jgi:hypothetical protein